MSEPNTPPATIFDFDRLGFILGPTDTLNDVRDRWEQAQQFSTYIDDAFTEKKVFTLFDLSYTPEMAVSTAQLHDCQKPIIEHYHCQTPWVPAFFCNKGLSFVFGGMALGFIDTDGLVQKNAEFSLFQLRTSFKEKERFLLYTRTEIIAHESCHIARMPLKAEKYEELIAYKISSSRFRRYWGPIIRKPLDVGLFFAGIIVFLLSQVSDLFYPTPLSVSICAKLPLFILLLFFIIRNYLLHRDYTKAHSSLQKDFADQADAVLFRLNDDEIDTLSSSKDWQQVEESLSPLRQKLLHTFKRKESPYG